jgi:hypothetical protein
MTNQPSRFIPPRLLTEQWANKAIDFDYRYEDDTYDYELHLVEKASEWTRDKMIATCIAWLKDSASLNVLTGSMRHKIVDEFFGFMTPLDTSNNADAARLRWMLNGNGYFLEEAGLCGRGFGTDADQARREIDKQMAMERNADE